MTPPDWLWIPISIFAAAAQTIRNAAQRHLVGSLGTLGATLTRFLYGLPFALAWLAIVRYGTDAPIPATNMPFWTWIVASAVSQIAATALLLKVMQARNFALGIAYAKTELMQVAVFGLVFLGDPISGPLAVAIALGSVGVLLLAPVDPERPFRSLLAGWTSRTALLGILSGGAFGIAAVGYRGAALALPTDSFLMAAALSLVAAQSVQTVVLGGWLLWRNRQVVVAVLHAWRTSIYAGLAGACASAGWFTATTLETAANVRTLGLIEMLFTYAVSRRFFNERLSRRELAAIALLTIGLVLVTLGY